MILLTNLNSWCCDISIWSFRRTCQIILSSWLACALGAPRQHGIHLLIMYLCYAVKNIYLEWLDIIVYDLLDLCRLLCSLLWVAMDHILDTGYDILMMWYENDTNCCRYVVIEKTIADLFIPTLIMVCCDHFRRRRLRPKTCTPSF